MELVFQLFSKTVCSNENVGRGGARFPFLLGELGLLDRMIEKPEDFVSKFNEAGLMSILIILL